MPYRPEVPRYGAEDRIYHESLTWPEWITIRRIRLGWTKKDLEDACKGEVSRVTMWRVEMSLVKPSASTVQAIEQVLDEAEAKASTSVAV